MWNWQPLGHGVETLFLVTPLTWWINFGVHIYQYKGFQIDAGPLRTLRYTSRAEALFITHTHEDHAGGASRLSLPIFTGKEAAYLLQNPPPLPLYRRLVWGTVKPVPAQAAERVGSFFLVPTPGHSPEHVIVYDEETGVVFGGDLFLSVKANLASPGFNVQALIHSLKKVIELAPRRFFCAHAGAVEEPVKALKAKVDFLELTRDQALLLKRKGLRPSEIRDRLFGGESAWALLSGGIMSRLRFVYALLDES
ncbi:MBL fold metallo-hydrolase [Thermus sp. 2.9]|uniref:MBL fold metallo-hydrolase n=1 Tax=Thermus sp. (strain 2.9) TaxID=1577051 RepID=UPI0009DCD6F0|nr:MBL fold metallo-hydrolase [Thermus sp. 2.9]